MNYWRLWTGVSNPVGRVSVGSVRGDARPREGARLLSWLLVCAAFAPVALGLGACGGSGGTRHAATVTTSQSYTARGKDEDGDIDTLGQGGRYDKDNDATFQWGPPASAADRRAVVALIKRYYEIAAAGDGAKACSMLDPLIVEMVAEAEPHHGCAHNIAKLFAQRHRQLVEDLSSFRVLTAQRRENRVAVLIDFAPTRLWQVYARRTHGAWRMDTPLFTAAE